MHMVVAVSYPLLDAMSGMAGDLFWLDVFNYCLKVRVLSGFVEDLVNGCFKNAMIFLFIGPRVEMLVLCLPDLDDCLPDEHEAFGVIDDTINLWVVVCNMSIQCGESHP